MCIVCCICPNLQMLACQHAKNQMVYVVLCSCYTMAGQLSLTGKTTGWNLNWADEVSASVNWASVLCFGLKVHIAGFH